MPMICSAEPLILDSHAYTLFAPVAILAQTMQLPPEAVSPSLREDEEQMAHRIPVRLFAGVRLTVRATSQVALVGADVSCDVLRS